MFKLYLEFYEMHLRTSNLSFLNSPVPLNKYKTSTFKIVPHLCNTHTNTATHRVSWSEEVRTICGILAVSGFGPVPWNPHSAGLLFVASSVFWEWHSSHCTGHWDRGGRPEKILGGGKQWLKSAHKCLLFSFGPLTLCLPTKQGPVRPAPLSNSLISRKNNNVRACFNWNENQRKDRKAAFSRHLSLSPSRPW